MPTASTHQPTNLHYGWVIAFTGTAVIFACLGLGRFALGMLLPSMGTALDLSYARMGLIGTGNFIGYMFAVALAGYVAQHLGARLTITLGLVLVGITMMLVGRAEHYLQILSLYVITGIGSGLSNVPLMGLVSHWFLKDARGRAAGIMLSGNGIAILCAGLYIPWINTRFGMEGWRYGWITMGMVVLGVAIMTAVLLRNDPREKGITPLGSQADPLNATVGSQDSSTGKPKWIMVHLGLIYALFGATYVVYATFIVTTLVDEHGFSEQVAGNFWAVVGALSIFSGPLFGWLSDRFGRRTGMLTVFTLFTLAYALVGMHLPAAWLYASIALYGIAVWSVPTIMAAAVGDYLGPVRAAKAFGFITLFFGMGQIVGPALAGFLADVSGTFRIAFGMCATATLTAVILTFFLPRPRP
ncbi:MAG: MFS transporter [Desulfobulbaceae bacterium C00003063]|nr:MAG: MFS transporter [Desulfobulbaceae bacterium C00003063]